MWGIVCHTLTWYLPTVMAVHGWFHIVKATNIIRRVILIKGFGKCCLSLVDLHRFPSGFANGAANVLFSNSFPGALKSYFFRLLFLGFFFSSDPEPFFQVFAAAFKLSLYDPPCFLWYALTWAIQAEAPIVCFYFYILEKNDLVGVCPWLSEGQPYN